MIAIVDYGMGNLKSVYNAFTFLKAPVVVTDDGDVIRKAEKIVLPGVGAFGDAMQELRTRGLEEVLREVIKEGKPFLGICLGLHILFEESEEAPGVKGLGYFHGTIKKLISEESHKLKIPHMGWNEIRIKKTDCPLMKGVSDKSYFYFVHSYYADCGNEESSLAQTEYGVRFSSMVWKDNVFAAQFHPEKSQEVGLTILKNFTEV